MSDCSSKTQSIVSVSSLVIGVLLLISIPGYGRAEDTLDSIFKRMSSEQVTRIRYYETRYLEFFNEPWKGTGFMYALAPDILIKEQLFPERELMGATAQSLYYYHPGYHKRFQSEIQADDPVSLNIVAFKALVNGDMDLLKTLYQPGLSHFSESWLLTLKPIHPDAADVLSKVEISGPTEQPANQIIIFQRDGDRTEYQLDPPVSDDTLSHTSRQLKQELIND